MISMRFEARSKVECRVRWCSVLNQQWVMRFGEQPWRLFLECNGNEIAIFEVQSGSVLASEVRSVRCGALQVRGSLDASGSSGESRSKSPRRTSCFLEVPTDPLFRSRSRSLDDGARTRVSPSDCEATYRIFDEIVKEGKTVCVLPVTAFRWQVAFPF